MLSSQSGAIWAGPPLGKPPDGTIVQENSMSQSVITANRLTDGAVVWLDHTDQWSDRLDTALVLDDEILPVSLERLQERDSNLAVDIRGIAVNIIGNTPVPRLAEKSCAASGQACAPTSPELHPTSVGRRLRCQNRPLPSSTSPFAGIHR
ncbi:DUF2849 domain-containing protein [Foliimonas ilicis]